MIPPYAPSIQDWMRQVSLEANPALTKAAETVSVKADYGADESNSDNTDNFNKALRHLISVGGGRLLVPRGRYRIKQQILHTIANQENISIVGEGRYQSILDFSDASTLGIELNSTTTAVNLKPCFEIRGLGIVTSHDNAGNAIRISYADANIIDNSVLIEDVLIGQNYLRGSDGGSGYGYWTKGVYLTNARVSKIVGLHFIGEVDKASDTQHGIYVDGETTEFVVDHCNILEANCGIEIAGTSEGVFVNNSVVNICRYGIRHNIASGAEPQLTVTGSHVNASEVCVWATNSQQGYIGGSLFYANTYFASPGPWPEWRGVLVDGSNAKHMTVQGNTFAKESGRTSDTTTGIDFAAGSYHTASGNHFLGYSGNALTYGVQARSGVSNVIVSSDNIYEFVTNRSLINAAATKVIRQPLVQSGVANSLATGATITFPKEFPNAVTSVVANHYGTNTAINVTTSSQATTGFVVNHNGGGNADIAWMATGE